MYHRWSQRWRNLRRWIHPNFARIFLSTSLEAKLLKNLRAPEPWANSTFVKSWDKLFWSFGCLLIHPWWCHRLVKTQSFVWTLVQKYNSDQKSNSLDKEHQWGCFWYLLGHHIHLLVLPNSQVLIFQNAAIPFLVLKISRVWIHEYRF